METKRNGYTEIDFNLPFMFCYAIERHFRGLEYKSLTPTAFKALWPLKTPRNRILTRGNIPHVITTPPLSGI